MMNIQFLAAKDIDIPCNKAFCTELGTRIWRNESGCSVEKLVWWNEGEAFMSLGIGHFLWYPKTCNAPFTQTFPELLLFLQQKGHTIPSWINDSKMYCPWTERSQVVGVADKRLDELRTFLHTTIADQAEFIVHRYKQAVDKIVKSAPLEQQDIVKDNMQLIAATPGGLYALIDYVNFKGEGTNPKEHYDNKGWGLLQVLVAVDKKLVQTNPCLAFASSAEKILKQRIENSPKERNEQRWLSGWMNRIATYVVK